MRIDDDFHDRSIVFHKFLRLSDAICPGGAIEPSAGRFVELQLEEFRGAILFVRFLLLELDGHCTFRSSLPSEDSKG